ncbi:oligosaccharide flippase family protein [uncultured Massilia sp.]|uniref:oligosaccharide flippase family protein n=1 Tax=uncultured Massilia sp. TaxID=169973 RepID=UPI0025E1613A|nr:oligosaccharide flippase family protein [uncultured Massilia sp.]
MPNLRRSLVITFLSSTGATVLQFAVSLMLARILTPAEIGVFSMTVVFTNFAHVFRDFGVSAYIQREQDLTPDKLRSAMGVLFFTSWLIATILLLASAAIGDWFAEPAIVPVLRVLAVGFFFIPFGSVTNALLARNFEAGKEAFPVAVGTVCFCVSCVTLAKLGFGSLSLAYANLINIIACTLAYIPMRPKGLPWLPSFKHWRGVAHFGLGSLASSTADTVNGSIPDIVLGKLGTARQVGLLSRANSTVTIFGYVAGATVSYGAVSYLAQLHHRGEPLAPMLARASTLLTGIGWPALALSAVLGRDIVLALYGPAWLDCVPAILPLALAGAIGMAFHYIPIALTSIGRPYLGAVPNLVSLLARIGFGVALFDGSLERFAWALCLAGAVTAPFTLAQQRRHFGYGIGAMLRNLAPSAAVTLGTAAAAWMLDTLLPPALPALARLLVMALPLAAVWYLLLRATRHALAGEVHRLAAPVKAKLALLRPNI